MIRINAKVIGIKEPVKVNESVKNVKETFKIQKDLIKLGKPKGKTTTDKVLNYYDGQLESIDKIINYIVDTLNLKGKYIDKLKQTNFITVQKLARQIVSKMLHWNKNSKKQSSGKK